MAQTTPRIAGEAVAKTERVEVISSAVFFVLPGYPEFMDYPGGLLTLISKVLLLRLMIALELAEA